jgi:hypothetical protein
MRNINFDTDGTPRCYNCGSKGFTEKRTVRSKVMGLGVGSMVTKKEMKCQRCGKVQRSWQRQTLRRPGISQVS